MIFQVIVNGLMLGAIYALVALGFTLIFGVMHIVNFAHGEMYTLAAFIVWALINKLGMGYWPCVLITIMVIVALAAIIERLTFRLLLGKGFQLLVCSLGILYIMQGGMLRIFGVSDKIVGSVFLGRICLGSIILSTERVFILAVTLFLVVAAYFFFDKTRLGRAMHATSQDAEVVALYGINASRIGLYCFTIGSALAGIAGALLAPVFVTDSTSGLHFLFKAFVVVVVGGLGSFVGAIMGGLAIGVLESFGLTFIGISTHFYIFMILIGVLIFRPKGLFGHA